MLVNEAGTEAWSLREERSMVIVTNTQQEMKVSTNALFCVVGGRLGMVRDGWPLRGVVENPEPLCCLEGDAPRVAVEWLLFMC